ncbi:RDD family protein [Methanobrevibacter curvatus]|uniref:RDD family protein n=1 Tax=Methanobrevibacter curvatus TaxID=49547 RepID=A0A166AZ89_9EURY|nr:RDD family protein [Methanobrevibacter curvatus]KZX12661.1 RDD family protein [Methanobrevibacter curvatus]
MLSIFKKRIVAYIADFFVVSAILWVIAQLAAYYIIPHATFIIYNYFIILVPIFTIVYFVFSEKNYKTTVGKHLMFLEVVSYEGNNISYKQAIARNLSKLYWFPIIIDFLIGKYTKSKDERILGQLSKTSVINEED